MSEKSVNRYIKLGNYNEAEYQTSLLDPVMKLVYQSRIAELTGDFFKAKKLSNEAITLAKSSDQRLASVISQAYANWRLFEFTEGHQVLQSVTAEVEEMRFDQNPWVGSFFNVQGLLYWKENLLDEAFNAFEQSLTIRESIGDTSPISSTLNNLGNTYLSFKDYEQAEVYYTRARDLRIVLNHKPALAASANSFGRLLDAIGNYTEATRFHTECLDLWKEVGNTQFIAKSYRFLAINAHHLRNSDIRDEYLDKSDQLFADIGNKTDLYTNKKLRNKYS